MRNVLLVRSRQELTDNIKEQLKDKFGPVEFVDVEPRTPSELHALCQQHDAVAVLLRENPLPLEAMKAGIPCIPLREGSLKRLISIEPLVESL